ncbi:hypothetical protein MTO96_035158 [Rhipicephalus appendiculatus]
MEVQVNAEDISPKSFWRTRVGAPSQLQANTIGDRRHKVSAYETAPDYTVKGIVRGIPLEEDARSIHTYIVHARNPHALADKRLSNTPTAIMAFEGPRVPNYVKYGGALLRCTLYRKKVGHVSLLRETWSPHGRVPKSSGQSVSRL